MWQDKAGFWYGRIKVDGKLKAINVGQVSKRQAEKKLAELDEIHNGFTLTEMKDLYVDYHEFSSEKTIKLAKYCWQEFVDMLEGISDIKKDSPASLITDEHIWQYQRYLANTKNNNETSQHIKLGTIKAMFKMAYNNHKIETEPFRGYYMPKKKIRNYYLSKKEVRKLLDVASENPLYYNYISFLIYTGCRSGELSNLRWKDVFEHHVEFFGKTGPRYFSINEDVERILKNIKRIFTMKGFKSDCVLVDYRTGRWIGYHGQLGKIVKRYMRKAKLDERYSAHTLRHTFATHHMSEGVSSYIVSKLTGHADSRLTEKWYGYAKPELKKSIKY